MILYAFSALWILRGGGRVRALEEWKKNARLMPEVPTLSGSVKWTWSLCLQKMLWVISVVRLEVCSQLLRLNSEPVSKADRNHRHGHAVLHHGGIRSNQRQQKVHSNNHDYHHRCPILIIFIIHTHDHKYNKCDTICPSQVSLTGPDVRSVKYLSLPMCLIIRVKHIIVHKENILYYNRF